jgi:hypothetical protein
MRSVIGLDVRWPSDLEPVGCTRSVQIESGTPIVVGQATVDTRDGVGPLSAKQLNRACENLCMATKLNQVSVSLPRK